MFENNEMKLWQVMTQLKGGQVLDQAVHTWNTAEWWWGIRKVAGSILRRLYSLEKYWKHWENLEGNTLHGVLFKH